jgi:uncharacterized protein (TIGR00369 family)
MSKLSVREFTDIIQAGLPMAAESGVYLQAIEHGTAEMVLPYNDNSIRPGGTIAGPHMMMLADVCMYAVVLSMIGEVKLAVTTNFNINFLRKPRACDLIARGKIIKLGKRLAIIEVSIYSDEDIVAHATGTYSIPPIEQT